MFRNIILRRGADLARPAKCCSSRLMPEETGTPIGKTGTGLRLMGAKRFSRNKVGLLGEGALAADRIREGSGPGALTSYDCTCRRVVEVVLAGMARENDAHKSRIFGQHLTLCTTKSDAKAAKLRQKALISLWESITKGAWRRRREAKSLRDKLKSSRKNKYPRFCPTFSPTNVGEQPQTTADLREALPREGAIAPRGSAWRRCTTSVQLFHAQACAWLPTPVNNVVAQSCLYDVDERLGGVGREGARAFADIYRMDD